MARLVLAQLPFNTVDLAGSLKLHWELFGFSSAGGNGLWGDVTGIHGLDETSRGMMWWMVNDQAFFQTEYFNFSSPMTRPMPADWSADRPGWVRCGMRVPDFDQSLACLGKWGIPASGSSTAALRDERRTVFRDPFAGVFVELMEDQTISRARLAYATNVVTDLEKAKYLHSEIFGAEILPLDTLHVPEDEALWGLGGAARDGFICRYDDRLIEILCYASGSTARAGEHSPLTDQGIPNVALASRDLSQIRQIIARLKAEGERNTIVLEAPGLVGTYFVSPGCQIELLGAESELDASLGFVPASPFFAEVQF